MNLPFQIRYLRGNVVHQVELELSPTRVAPADVAEYVRPLLTWLEVGRLGGMCGDSLPPWRSTLAAQPLDGMPDQTVVVRAADVLIDPRAFTILENVLHHVHASNRLVGEVRVLAELSVSYQSLRGEFPGLYEPVPFVYSYDAVNQDVHVEIEFETEQPPEVLDDVQARVIAWGDLGALCGYAEADMLPSSGYLVVDDVERYVDMITVSIQRKGISEFAFDGLVNMLQVVHAERGRLRGVRVL